MSNLELFPSWPQDCIPSIQDGETLFSWCSLYHRLSGSKSPSSTSKRLFGAPTSGFVRDFPARIDRLVHVTDGMLGTADHLIENHTLYRLYSKFRSIETMSQVKAMMQGSSVERLKFILGLPSSRANASHPLKLCRECVADEVGSLGFARWWVNHQWPTVWVCEKHNQLLDWFTDSFSRPSKTPWILPSDLNLSRISSTDGELASHRNRIAALAKLTTHIADCDNPNYLPQTLRLAFLGALKARGWLSTYGDIQYATIRNAFIAQLGALSLLPGMDFINSTKQKDYGFLGTLLRGRNRFLHPSKYLVMINFLFEDMDTFQSSYGFYASSQDIEETKAHILNSERIGIEDELHRLVVLKGHSLNQTASQLNISVANVIAWAQKNDIKYDHRPRLETEELLNAMKELIEKGASREFMVEKLGVRRRWITSFFRRNPSLRDQWKKQNLIAKTQQKRETFQKIIERHPGAPLKAILSIPANGYFWLKRNDRQWLENNLPLFYT